ncbi:MAG: alginate export family protein [Tannerellaceae bacterium]|nr:alginate export family protein [Tannerellaceae bacterium]
MKNYRRILAFLILILIPAALALRGQTIGMNGEIRSRIEYRDGFRKPLADTLQPATIASLRTRIQLDYSSEKIKTKIILQDARIYGQTGTTDTRNSLGIYEAWGSYSVTPHFSVTLGRQGLEYDDKRLFTVANWSYTGRAHDMLLLKYESPDLFDIHAGVARNNDGDNESETLYTVEKNYKALTYIWLGKSFRQWNISAIWINDAFDRANDTGSLTDGKIFRNTIGGNLGLGNETHPLSLYATGYYQFGRDMQDMTLDAYLLAMNVKYQPSVAWNVIAGVDYFSGSAAEDIRDNKNKTFNKLYGSNNSFNGMMEYWTTPPVQGLCDLYGAITISLLPGFDANASFHSFALVRQLDGTNKKNIGAETDLTLNYSLSQQLSLQAGWSVYFKNRQTDILKGADTRSPHWGYVMLTFKPQWIPTK